MTVKELIEFLQTEYTPDTKINWDMAVNGGLISEVPLEKYYFQKSHEEENCIVIAYW